MTATPEHGRNSENDQQTGRNEWELTLPQLFGLVILLILVWVGLIVFVSIDVARLFVSGLTPLIVVVLGYVFNQRLKKYQVEWEQRQAEIERRHKERIEFSINANFYGPKQGSFLSEFLIYIHNKSNVEHNSNNITLRVRGLKKDEEPTEWVDGDREHEVEFPCKLIDENVIPEDMRPIFVEPDVKQPITYVTRIDEEYEYILANAKFHYIGKSAKEGYEPHSVERLFALEPMNDSSNHQP